MRPDDFGAELDRRKLLHLLSELIAVLRPCRHGPDFACVVWYGVRHTFTPAQARVARMLWEAWVQGTPDVHQETLLDAAGSEGRLRSLFQGHPAWGSMIVPGAFKGLYRLADMREGCPSDAPGGPVEP